MNKSSIGARDCQFTAKDSHLTSERTSTINYEYNYSKFSVYRL